MAASAEEFAQLKKIMQELRRGQLDLTLRLESLEDRMLSVEKGQSSGPPKPEPTLSCVQCGLDYKESRNADGDCKYHSAALKGMGWDFLFPCCNQKSRNFESAKSVPGCTKGQHRSKHHMEYTYSAYYFYITEQSQNAKEVWMCLDVKDRVTECSEWGEVGVNKAGKLYVLMGSSRVKCTAFAEFSVQELQQCEEQETLAAGDSVGWSLNAVVTPEGGVAKDITVSIKSAHSTTPLAKKVEIVLEGEILRRGKIVTLSDPTTGQVGKTYSVPAPMSEGPILDPGIDYSKDRKNNYETETTDDYHRGLVSVGNEVKSLTDITETPSLPNNELVCSSAPADKHCCPVTVQQHGKTEVDSGGVINGQWNNLFTAQVKVTNTSQQNLAITNIMGHYMNTDGEWVKCEQVYLGQLGWRNSYNWLETNNLSLEPASTVTVAVRLVIPFKDKPPSSNQDRCRAHISLPQPLHLKATFVDHNKATASFRFEQGNPPLDIPTRELREKNWGKGSLEFYIAADDIEGRKRSDAALYYDEKGTLNYRPSVNGNSSQYFLIASSLPAAAYKAAKACEKEVELEKMKKEAQGSSVRVFALVDTDSQSSYALKVVIVTPTSNATGYYLLCYDDPSSVSIRVQSQQVAVKSDFTVDFQVPRASKSDHFEIYPYLGKSNVGRAVTNKDGKTSGSVKMVAPDTPGEYEIRYYPAWLNGQVTGDRHSAYWPVAACTFNVTN